MEYEYKKEKVIDLNKRNHKVTFPLLSALVFNNENIFKLIIEYVERHDYSLNINQKRKAGYQILYTAISNKLF
ncbi:hypothetical protein PIROE2DRAFT_67705 [Piromyces sp. E2]|nr:hypothetical protein PIROE2DRAFT_67705 [Piromyces sp. E2]|eukprot:OUM59084.1 hypothetical protein PIROE2DRAFT_67705 [Piromyces sp. E2]